MARGRGRSGDSQVKSHKFSWLDIGGHKFVDSRVPNQSGQKTVS